MNRPGLRSPADDRRERHWHHQRKDYLHPMTKTNDLFSFPTSFILISLLFLSTLFIGPQDVIHAQVLEANATESDNPLRQMSLEQLGNIEVTTASKAPEEVWKTPAAIYVITQEDIERSGATNIPEALRLAPGIEVARIDGDKWSIGIRGSEAGCRDQS